MNLLEKANGDRDYARLLQTVGRGRQFWSLSPPPHRTLWLRHSALNLGRTPAPLRGQAVRSARAPFSLRMRGAEPQSPSPRQPDEELD